MNENKKRRSYSMNEQCSMNDYSIGAKEKTIDELKTKETIEKQKEIKILGYTGYCKYILSSFYFLFQVIKIYLFWITLHYFASQYYAQYCASYTIYGFLLSPFLVSTPHCQALRWTIYKGGIIIENMWIILGAWISAKIMIKS